MRFFFIIITLSMCLDLRSQQIISTQKTNGIRIPAAALCIDAEHDFTLVTKAAALFTEDVQKVTGTQPVLLRVMPSAAKQLIVIGSIERSDVIKDLIARKKINVDSIRGKWEAYQVQVVQQPFPGVEQALVITGSDRRGTAYGVFELCQQIGVSPWYWWADVPVKKNKELYVKSNAFMSGAPAVKYRGIFINDEAPALSGWSKSTFGGFNHLFYEKVFELMLRLKSNYLWPAMWGNAFYDDDKLNMQTADDYGIVIGTSHHEPLTRAHDEWRRYGSGKWNYDSNETKLKEFWRGGLQRAGNTEKIVSIGMRGDGDEPMTQGTAIALLERIVKDQRNIIEEVSGKPAAETPQLWALYKEVQDYYDKGMRVPDDVTLLLCDDNWGNIRKLPKLDEKPRKGGYGIYYHFDYVGGPRNYKWLNTNNIARVWEQMHLAWEYNAREIWIVNVGDIKPMEFPISFFLDYAWDPKKWNEDNLREYYINWAEKQFGKEHARMIGQLIRQYSQYAARRKPELLAADTYNVNNYNEATRVVLEWRDLLDAAKYTESQLAPEYKDAFYQLVMHPIKAMSNLHEMYLYLATNDGKRATEAFIQDSLISKQYNKGIANGKWNHMMDQTHIGYTGWQQPPVNKMPEPVQLANTHDVNVLEDPYKYVSIEAEHFTKAINTNNIRWKVIPDIGRTASGICAFPVTAPQQQAGGNSPHVTYEVNITDTGKVTVHAYFSPTLNFHNTSTGLRYAVSINDETPQVISINKEDNNVRIWGQWVSDNTIIKTSTHSVLKPGRHVLRYWVVDTGVVLQKLVIDYGGLKPSYLGPPEPKRK